MNKLNVFASDLNIISNDIVVFNLDSTCQLCSLELLEIENLRKAHFIKYDALPIAVLYGEVNDYTMKIIKEKKVYNFPIYNISYDNYIEYIYQNDMNYNVWVISKTGSLVYGGNPFYEQNDLQLLIKTLKSLQQ